MTRGEGEKSVKITYPPCRKRPGKKYKTGKGGQSITFQLDRARNIFLPFLKFMCVLGTPFFVDQWWWSGGVIHPFYSPILLAPSGPIRTVQGKGRIFLVEERGEGGTNNQHPVVEGKNEGVALSVARRRNTTPNPGSSSPAQLLLSRCFHRRRRLGAFFWGGINRWERERESVAWVFSFPRNSWLLFRRYIYRISTRRIVLISKHR